MPCLEVGEALHCVGNLVAGSGVAQHAANLSGLHVLRTEPRASACQAAEKQDEGGFECTASCPRSAFPPTLSASAGHCTISNPCQLRVVLLRS